MERVVSGDPCLIEAGCCAHGLECTRACLPLVAHITWRAESVALRAQTALRGEEYGLASGQVRAVLQLGSVESFTYLQWLLW